MISWVLVVCCRRTSAYRLSCSTAKASALTSTREVRRASFTASPEKSGLPCEAPVSESSSSSSSSSAETVRAAAEATAKWSAALPDIPYGFPASDSNVFAAERCGGIQKRWLQDLPREVDSRSNGGSPGGASVWVERYLPNKEDFWRSPPYEALREIVLRSPYHDALRIIMEHDYRFLFTDVMCNVEAPMPHVIYEDFMKCLTFSSLQQQPEEQFALPEPVLRDLLCWAAYYCTLDRFYFTSASMLFRKVEQEQHMSPAVHSAWVYICTAAGKLDEALAYAAYMDTHSIPFDPDVFALLLHPSLTPVQQRLHQAPQTSKGVVMQRRLCLDMSRHHGTMPVAVHAMFVYHILTLQHKRKWEVLRGAAELFNRRQERARCRRGLPSSESFMPVAGPAAEGPRAFICTRTMHLAMSLFCREKGVRWGPRTTREMVAFMLENFEAGSTVADVLFVLMRVRRNGQTRMLAALPQAVFSAQEQEALMRATHRRIQHDPSCAVAAPLLRELLAADGGSDSHNAIDRAMRHLQMLAASTTDYGAVAEASSPSLPAEAAASAPPLDKAERCRPAVVQGGLEADERSSLTSLSEAMEQVREETPVSPAEAARDLLAAVMALDRESVAAAPAARTGSGAKKALSMSLRPSSSTAREEDRLRELHVTLEAMGTSPSLSAWSLQQLLKEEEEARLQHQAANAWISPAYVPR
ncbi:hypothetical protein LSCM1_06440 [Leishmania martiniquensis]|uniref:Uncharacterized protein n=1 Tax=Leishmania martiniquensis TaxID=1580590 RepID=A0A836KLJ3_9TRYP|nr:hypothetical protein LSCM1_06440 [Leishmania martiniquensis]